MKLTKEEQNLLVSVEAGEWKSVKNLSDEKKRYAKIARNTLRGKAMTWRYIPVRYKCEDGTWVYTVQEFYGKSLYTADMHGIAAMGESRKELIRDLEMMLKDLKKHPTKTIKMKDMVV